MLLQGDVVDVVEIERSAFGQVEPPVPLLFGAGERASFVAVEFAFDQLGREEGAADFDVRETVAVAAAVDRRRHQVLAHARLAAQQHVGVAAAQISIIRRTWAMAAERPMIAWIASAAGAGWSGGWVRAGFSLALDSRQQRQDVFVAERFGEEVERAELDRFDGHGNAAVGGHHDDFHVGQRALLDPFEQFDAVELGHLHVGDHDVEPRLPRLRIASSPSRGGHDLVALGREVVGQGDAFDLFVVDDEDSHGGLVRVDRFTPVRRFSCRPV